jgi:hypothetical protein
MTLPFTQISPDDTEVHDLENGTPRLAPIPFWETPDAEALPNGQLAGYEGKDFPDNPWDQLLLNGAPVPGVSTVKCVPKIRLRTNKTVGHDGGPTIEEGHEAAGVMIAIKIWTPTQWLKLLDILAEIWRRPGSPIPAGDKKAVRIWHPACAMWGVAAVLLESPESPDPGPEPGTKVVKIKAVQYIPPKQRNVTRAAKGTGGELAKAWKDPKNTRAAALPAETESSALPPAVGAEGPR